MTDGNIIQLWISCRRHNCRKRRVTTGAIDYESYEANNYNDDSSQLASAVGDDKFLRIVFIDVNAAVVGYLCGEIGSCEM